MAKPNVMVLTGYGINCDEETKFAFEKVGAKGELVHINDLIDKNKSLLDYQILSLPGGFSYGDDTGAGNALSNRIRNHLWDEVLRFVESDRLAIGICNGFQIMVNLGLLPAINDNYGKRQVALLHNTTARYIDRWVDLKFEDQTVWTRELTTASFPIAHGEGKFYADAETLKIIEERSLVAARYVNGEIHRIESQQSNHNPNGSLNDIAAISDESGRLLGIMPHPERAIEFTQHPHWTLHKEMYRRAGKEISNTLLGIQIFKNGVEYFS